MILHKSFEIGKEGHLTIDGLDAEALASRFGTPAMFISEDAVRDMCRMYQAAFSKYFGGASAPVYAGKALCFKRLYTVMAEENMLADCVSSGEIATANAAGFPMKNVFFHGNNKTDYDLGYAVEQGVGHIVVDGVEELLSLDKIAADHGVCQKILLRITPGIDPHTHKKIITGNVDSKFGSAIETGDAERIVRLALSLENVCLEGLHCHVGSQIFDIAPFRDAADIMLRFIADMKEKAGLNTKILNLGGGFGVRYTEDDPEIDYAENVRLLGVEIDKMCEQLNLTKPDIHMEPGRSIVAAAGATLYRCGSVKEIKGFRNYVSIDGGMTDNPRYTLYQSQYTVLNASKAAAPADFECTLAGRCCESGDLLAENIKIARPERGDIIAVLVTGAYNYSMASNYNKVARPPIVMISGGKPYLAVRRETAEDMMALDV
ncbi:MAG: diaminopimelate decarboxylase [Clostridiales bacterium]|nr:diaminopimelate decarboxylase [Clostridiales bacterium]